MLQQDYLMRLIMEFVVAVRRVMEKPESDPLASAAALESAMAHAIDLDAGVVLRLQPESFGSLLKASGTDPEVALYLAHALVLEASFLREAGECATADLRAGQAAALCAQFGLESVSAGAEEAAEMFLDT